MKVIPETLDEVMGMRLAKIRKACHIGQAAAGKSLGISQSAYSRLERGQTVLAVTQVRKLARLYGRKTHELVDELLQDGDIPDVTRDTIGARI